MKNRKIERLISLKAINHAECKKIQERIQAEYNRLFKKDKTIQDAIKALECGGEYTTDESGEIQRWVRFETSNYKDCLDALGEYLSENHFMYLDAKNDCIQTNEGESLVINEDGDVFLGHKVVIDSDTYSDTKERNRLIEEYMERSGYFPGVFEQSRNGDVWLVNTQEKE